VHYFIQFTNILVSVKGVPAIQMTWISALKSDLSGCVFSLW